MNFFRYAYKIVPSIRQLIEEDNMDIDQAQKQYDKELPDDEHICLRCEEEQTEDGEDFCRHCQEIIRNNNRDRFQAEETY